MPYQPKTRLSASRIKSFNDCSQVYAAKYLQKVPDKTNLGATLGDIAHVICETLLKPQKYQKLVAKITKSGKFPKSFNRWITKLLKKTEFYHKDHIETIKSFVLVALKNDFWLAGGELQEPEWEFEIKEDYWVCGFVDKFAIFTDGREKWVTIIDYKSQKVKFGDKEMDFHVQGLMYLLAVKQRFPEINLLRSSVKFILLRHPEDPVQEVRLKSLQELEEFKQWLREKQKEVDAFTVKDATKRLAASLGWVDKEQGFAGLLKCGGRCQFPGQLKKDGTLYYYCSLKFPFDYYVLVDKDGQIKYTSLKMMEEKNGLKLEGRHYTGCPAFSTAPEKGDGKMEDLDF